MIHAREDYNRFQDPENKIPKDEPVMLFRAQDKHFNEVLSYYQGVLVRSGNFEVAEKVEDHIKLAKKWRKSNLVKEPDL